MKQKNYLILVAVLNWINKNDYATILKEKNKSIALLPNNLQSRTSHKFVFSPPLWECWEATVASILFLTDNTPSICRIFIDYTYLSILSSQGAKKWVSLTTKLINSVFCSYYNSLFMYVSITEVFCLWFTAQVTNHHNHYFLFGSTDWIMVM